MIHETKKYRDPFKGMSFKGKTVSKKEYIAAYESYMKRCSENNKFSNRVMQKIEKKLAEQKSKSVNL